jgi:DNA-directed RNA polymerase specialized sigma24 family protein
MTKSTSQFLECLAAGDFSVWNSFYDKYAPLLYGIIRKQVPEEISDVVLEKLFLSLYRRIDEFEPGTQLLFTWMYKIALETCEQEKINARDAVPITPDLAKPDMTQSTFA